MGMWIGIVAYVVVVLLISPWHSLFLYIPTGAFCKHMQLSTGSLPRNTGVCLAYLQNQPEGVNS